MLLDRLSTFVDYPWLADTCSFVEREMLADADDGSHDAGHLLRVTKNVVEIADGESADDRESDLEIIVAAALTHDLVNLPKDHPDRSRASALSAEKAVDFFEDVEGFSDERLQLLAEAVECHSFSRGMKAESLEGKILTDADRLDALGAVGIARTFYVAGTLESSLFDPDDPFAEDRPRDDTQFAVDHFFEKLLRLKDSFYTPTGRAMAERRHQVMLDFLDNLSAEIDV